MRTVETPLAIGGSTIRNRLYRAPVLEGAGDGDDAADAYVKQFAANAEAGYDGVQLGSANAKLLDQLLSPFYNRRDDEFGGSLDNRARVLRLIREAVAERAGADYPCTVKVPAETSLPFMPRTLRVRRRDAG